MEMTTLFDQIHGLVDNLDEGLEYKSRRMYNVDRILIIGMGGSGIGADMIFNLCSETSCKQIITIKDTILPEWVDERTLVIAVSYSGNTKETLQMYDEAKKRGCWSIVVTSGGKLEKQAIENRDELIMLPCAMQPRQSVGFVIGCLMSVMRQFGCESVYDSLKAAIPKLREFRDEIEETDGADFYAIAEDMSHIPFLCCDAKYQSAIVRLKNQLNENAKSIAYSQCLQEFRSADLEVWVKNYQNEYKLVLFCDEGNELLNYVRNELDMNGIDYIPFELTGESVEENLMRIVLMGDYMSYYVAMYKGVNPAEVPAIAKLKKYMGYEGKYSICAVNEMIACPVIKH